MRTAPLSGDSQSFTKYATMVRDLADLKENKNDQEMYTTNLNSHIIQFVSQSLENHPLLLALEQEANRATAKLEDLVGFMVP